MAQTFTSLIYHVVFSTKNRVGLIRPEIRAALFAYMGGIIRNLRAKPILINGVDDHAHALVGAPPTLCISDLVGKVKSNSTGWIHQEWPKLSHFGWQDGYAAFTVCRSDLNRVYRYIAQQEQHHQRVSFKDELRRLLRQHGIEFDERYLWD
ncbi:MAG TPA: IS200/IS605 family transposase [Acidobacteriota bacterium]|jgi:REP element-mobilizing transposase RayT|nr:IS200/IS605 family transposase [Acidobacteriota bacterium]